MPVRTAVRYHLRNAPGIYDDGSFGAGLASVRWVGARFLAPRGPGTEEPSNAGPAPTESIWLCFYASY